MKQNIGAKQALSDPAAESPSFEARPSSPDQLAAVWNAAGQVVAAMPVPVGSGSIYEIDLARLNSDHKLGDAIRARRESYRTLPQVSEATQYLTVVRDYSERTRVLALDGSVLAYDDLGLLEWLIEAEKHSTPGTDGHPVFETALEDTACSITRLPNGLVSMTEVPRRHVEAARARIDSITGRGASGAPILTVETPLRAAVRYFLNAQPEGDEVLMPGKVQEVTAFLLLNKAGFRYGLWSPRTGLFSEYAFPAPADVVDTKKESEGEEESEAERAASKLEIYVRHAFDQLFLQMSPEKLESLGLSNYAQVVWAAEPELEELTAQIAADYAADSGLGFVRVPVPVDEAVAGGLLFGSFTFGEATVVGARNQPQINLARDLLVLADKEDLERRRIEDLNELKRHNRDLFILVAAPVVVLAVLVAFAADILRTQVMLGIRDYRAEARTAELKPALDRRKSYEANLKWYQEFIKQVSQLRRQQPVGIGLHYELDSRYPLDTDPSFYVSELKLLPSGELEMKGLARNKDSVTSFLRALEFAGGQASGTKLFSNLTYEVQEGVAAQTASTSGRANLPTMSGSGLAVNAPAPGVISWGLKGNYLPIAEFVPPDPSKNPVTAANPAQVPPVQ